MLYNTQAVKFRYCAANVWSSWDSFMKRIPTLDNSNTLSFVWTGEKLKINIDGETPITIDRNDT